MKTDNRQRVGAVIAAAGKGRRMGGVDKAFTLLGGRLVLARVIDTFQECNSVDQVIVVVGQESQGKCRQMITEEGWPKVTGICTGGERRQDSVAAGIKHLKGCNWVIIHDGARPLVTIDLIDRGVAAAEETGAAIAGVPVTDTIKQASDSDLVTATLPRSNLWMAQTPQVFRFDILAKAHQLTGVDTTDDAALVEKLGHQVKLYIGNYDNIKITTPDDLIMAEALLRKDDS